MYIDLNTLQGKPWHEQVAVLVETADKIVKEYQSPFKNDAKGSLDCYLLEDKLQDCLNIINRHHKKEGE